MGETYRRFAQKRGVFPSIYTKGISYSRTQGIRWAQSKFLRYCGPFFTTVDVCTMSYPVLNYMTILCSSKYPLRYGSTDAVEIFILLPFNTQICSRWCKSKQPPVSAQVTQVTYLLLELDRRFITLR